MDNKKNERYCGHFNMTAKEFQEYKDWKKTKVFLYIIGMIVSTILVDRIFVWTMFTLVLIRSINHASRCEEQWIKDGAITEEDLK